MSNIDNYDIIFTLKSFSKYMHTFKSNSIVVSIVGVIILSILLGIYGWNQSSPQHSFVSNSNISNSKGNSVSDTSNSSGITSQILGAWSYASTTDPDFDEVLGFVVTASGTKEVRVYSPTDSVTGNSDMRLTGLFNWNISTDDSGFNVINFTDLTDDTVDHTYKVVSISSTTLMLDEVSSYDASITSKTYTRIRSASDEQAKQLYLSGQDHDIQCTKIMSGDDTDYPVLLPITCDASVKQGEAPLHFTFTDQGNIEVRRGTDLIFNLDQHESNALDVPDILSASGYQGPFIDTSAVTLEDVTFDGYKDLAVKISTGAYNFTYNYFPYDPVTKTFSKRQLFNAHPEIAVNSPQNIINTSEDFYGITNPEINTKARTITSNDLGRGIGDIYENRTYVFQNGEYVLTEIESQDMTSDIDATTTTYQHTVRQFKNGAWATTSDETLGDQFGPEQGSDLSNATSSIPLFTNFTALIQQMKDLGISHIELPATTSLPALLQQNNIYTSINSSGTYYSILFMKSADCAGADACTIATFKKDQIGNLDTLGDAVTLNDGTVAYYFAGSCGGSCSPATITWMSSVHDVGYMYQIQMDAPESVLVQLANESI